jgi:hypothetical protein
MSSVIKMCRSSLSGPSTSRKYCLRATAFWLGLHALAGETSHAVGYHDDRGLEAQFSAGVSRPEAR